MTWIANEMGIHRSTLHLKIKGGYYHFSEADLVKLAKIKTKILKALSK